MLHVCYMCWTYCRSRVCLIHRNTFGDQTTFEKLAAIFDVLENRLWWAKNKKTKTLLCPKKDTNGAPINSFSVTLEQQWLFISFLLCLSQFFFKLPHDLIPSDLFVTSWCSFQQSAINRLPSHWQLTLIALLLQTNYFNAWCFDILFSPLHSLSWMDNRI